MYKMLVLQVREMLELHLSAYEIAHRLKVDVETVQAAIDVIQSVLV